MNENLSYKLRSFIEHFKHLNKFRPYTVDKFHEVMQIYRKVHVANNYIYLYWLIGNEERIVDLINNTFLDITLEVFTPDHEYSPKHTFSGKTEESINKKDTLYVEVYSSKGLVESYSLPLEGVDLKIHEIVWKYNSYGKPNE